MAPPATAACRPLLVHLSLYPSLCLVALPCALVHYYLVACALFPPTVCLAQCTAAPVACSPRGPWPSCVLEVHQHDAGQSRGPGRLHAPDGCGMDTSRGSALKPGLILAVASAQGCAAHSLATWPTRLPARPPPQARSTPSPPSCRTTWWCGTTRRASRSASATPPSRWAARAGGLGAAVVVPARPPVWSPALPRCPAACAHASSHQVPLVHPGSATPPPPIAPLRGRRRPCFWARRCALCPLRCAAGGRPPSARGSRVRRRRRRGPASCAAASGCSACRRCATPRPARCSTWGCSTREGRAGGWWGCSTQERRGGRGRLLLGVQACAGQALRVVGAHAGGNSRLGRLALGSRVLRSAWL